jgi:hypothetical protein
VLYQQLCYQKDILKTYSSPKYLEGGKVLQAAKKDELWGPMTTRGK